MYACRLRLRSINFGDLKRLITAILSIPFGGTNVVVHTVWIFAGKMHNAFLMTL
jgi:hypothetical protein